MVVNATTRNRTNPNYPSGLMRRLGYEDATEGRERMHGGAAYREGYDAGLKDSGRTTDNG